MTSSDFPALDASNMEIRLLELQPGSQDSPIYGNYRICGSDCAPCSYEALSYAWGDPSSSEQHTIFLNDRPVVISHGLFSSLHTLRRSDESRCLWIDALCINQSDDTEKTQQVSMMHSIYKECTQCAIWLGSLGPVPPSYARGALDAITWIAGEQEIPPWFDDPVQRGGVASAVNTLMTLPWWYRIWTVQESILPPAATLYWGPFSLPWELMRRAADSFFNGTAPELPGEFWNHGGILHLHSSMRGLGFSRDEDVLLLLWRWRGRFATEPRDKVYGLMGIQSKIPLPSARSCDYTVDVPTLYARVTADLIRHSGTLEALIGRRGEMSDIKGLPSWAVDWAGPVDRSKMVSRFWDHRRRWHGLNCTADRGIYGVSDGLKMLGERVLCLHGLFLGRIAVVECSEDGVGNGGTSYAQMLSGGDRWSKLISRFQEAYPGNLPGNWMRSLFGVVMGRLIPGDPDHGDAWDDWLPNMVTPQAIFITQDGQFGLGPRNAEPGQEVWVVGGSRFPLILNPQSYAEERVLDFTFAGECFVYGIMKGEAVEGRQDEVVEFRLH